MRFGNFVQIRGIIDDEFEGAWSGEKNATAAPDGTAKRGNELFMRLEKASRYTGANNGRGFSSAWRASRNPPAASVFATRYI